MSKLRPAMPERIAALEERVERVEDGMSAGLDKITRLIQSEIKDLKSEQLADIKTSIDRVERDFRVEHGRLADDQRRLWDAVRNLEAARDATKGERRAVANITHVLSLLCGGAAGALATALVSHLVK